MTQNTAINKYWGKSSEINQEYYYLSIWEHSLNVAAVAKIWLEKRHLFLQRWAKLLGLEINDTNLETAKNLALHFILLHDLGKYDWRFQAKNTELVRKLNEVEPDFFNKANNKIRFDHGGWGLYYYAIVKGGKNEEGFIAPIKIPWYYLIRAAAVHHGSYCGQDYVELMPKKRNKFPEPFVLEVIRKHIQKVETLFPLPVSTLCQNAASATFLSGLCTLSDWLGSNTEFFPLKAISDHNEPNTITKAMLDKSEKTLRAHHLLGKYSGDISNQIPRIFGKEIQNLYPLQQTTLDIKLSDTPQMFIVEAPMGEGKTEAAMILTDRLLAMNAADSFYFALPTMATSNAMYTRLATMLGGESFFDAASSLVLAHGKRQLDRKFQDHLVRLLQQDTTENFEKDSAYKDQENLSAIKLCNQFFAQSHKRSLLANAGVGTIDQAMSAVLLVRHHWVKLFGLTNSVLIIDEVHAYDAYMMGIIGRLIQWMNVLGTHVVLLSATLPGKTKNYLIRCFSGKDEIEGEENAYPLLTHCLHKNENFHLNSVKFPHNIELEKEVYFKLTKDVESVKSFLREHCAKGAQACFVFNTVRKAQDFFDELQRKITEDDIEIFLFHSRFMQVHRGEIEDKVLQAFGKGNSNRTKKGRILIATQVVEQSLDVDFDIMFSEMAPIDLLLQRAGRLHRHGENKRLRQDKDWKQPCLFVYSPCETIPEWLEPGNSSARSVYDASILFRTALLFEENEDKFPVRIPQDIRSLVESVYGDNDEAIPVAQYESYQKRKAKWENDAYSKDIIAKHHIQPYPDSNAAELKDAFKNENSSCAELDDNFEAGGTRLTQTTVQVVFADPAWLNEISGWETNNQQYRELKRKLQEHSVTIVESMLKEKGSERLKSEDFDLNCRPEGKSWNPARKIFRREFSSYEDPLILPFDENNLNQMTYTFNDSAITLTYSKSEGLIISK